MLGRLRIFEDWTVGCDNRLRCEAVSLVPDGAGDSYAVLVSIERQGGPFGAARLLLSGANDLKGKIDLFADNKQIGQLVALRDQAEATGEIALRLIRTLGSSYAFEVRQAKTVLDAPSLSGLAQALRYMDEQQGRVASRGALAALGDGPADMARPVPPDATFPLALAGPPPPEPMTLGAPDLQAARRLALCDGRLRDDYPVEIHGLDASHVLALFSCDAGTDNVSNVPLVGTGAPGQRSFQIARFDLIPGSSGEPGTPPLIVNAKWNPVRSELSSFARGRPLGDCGTSETYRWDGAQFRLVEARAMPVCRGAWTWPVLWTAQPAAVTPPATLARTGGR